MSALDQIIAAYVKNGGNQSAAWKTANPDSKAKPESIHQKASKFSVCRPPPMGYPTVRDLSDAPIKHGVKRL
jgi:hypothetical protein